MTTDVRLLAGVVVNPETDCWVWIRQLSPDGYLQARRDASPSSRSPQPDSLPAGATTSTGAIGGDGSVEHVASARGDALPAWPPAPKDGAS